MDSLSSKVKISYQITSEFSFVKGLKSIPSQLMNIEGDLNIVINNQIFFEEPIALYEFYCYLDRWLYDWEKGHKISFEYVSMESEENPLLAFKLTTSGFQIFSVWQQYNSEEIFDTNDFKDYIALITGQIEKDIIHTFGEEYMNYKELLPIKKM
ncbi:hypothetical protein HCJ66_10660 [Listeria sp. FSL L7-1582]|uniref:DUF7878 domain-containing protein n=1 Tax=Listeria portnoyi TaxID=2713504 RepID=UPI00164D446A|nr:hypothetical protein [Listeria portnoyi]MBC6310001.1 hypothetical protein [Listeria portnoyi]